jgi:hypothetical protein
MSFILSWPWTCCPIHPVTLKLLRSSAREWSSSSSSQPQRNDIKYYIPPTAMFEPPDDQKLGILNRLALLLPPICTGVSLRTSNSRLYIPPIDLKKKIKPTLFRQGKQKFNLGSRYGKQNRILPSFSYRSTDLFQFPDTSLLEILLGQWNSREV